MPDAFSIKLYLLDGDPSGVVRATRDNWNLVAVRCPRSRYPNVSTRAEFTHVGVYVLVGHDVADPSSSRIYVGQTGRLHGRIDQHMGNESKSWFEHVVTFSAGRDLNVSDVCYLEERLIALARASGRSAVDNERDPHPPVLDEAQEVRLTAFLEHILMMCPLLGIEAFNPLPRVSAVEAPARAVRELSSVRESPRAEAQATRFALTASAVDAQGVIVSNGFLVLAGSRGRRDVTSSIPAGLLAHRQRLIDERRMVPDPAHGNELVLTQDLLFSSPSKAAGVLTGGSINGRTSWKTSDGRTLSEVEAASLEPYMKSYEAMRDAMPPSDYRTQVMDRLVVETRATARAGMWTAGMVCEQFAIGTPGARMVSIAVLQEIPALVTYTILAEAIREPLSGMEQYHALVTAEQALPYLSRTERAELRDMLASLSLTGDRAVVSSRLAVELR